MAVRTRRRSTFRSTVSLSAYSSLVLSDGAVGYWPLSEASGSTAFDATSNGRNGTYSGNFSLANAALGGGLGPAVSLDGTDDYISVADNNAWSCAGNSGTITVEAWIKPTAINRASQFIVAKHEEWQLRIESDGRILWDVNYQGLSSIMNCYSTILTAGQTYHVMATYNRATPRAELYVNGVLSGSSTSATGWNAENRSANLRIAGRSDNGGNEFQGSISDVAIYPTVLSATQIANHNALGRSTVTENAPPIVGSPTAVWWADDIVQADGSAVASWTDRVSGLAVSQATAGSRPILDADGLNGKPSVNFDGTDDHLSYIAANAVSVSGQGCVVAVIQRTSGDGRLWSSAQHAAGPNYVTGRFSSGIPAISQSSNGGSSEDLVRGQTSIGTSYTVVEWSSNDTQYGFRLTNTPEAQTVSSGSNTGDWFGDTPNRDNWTLGAIKYGIAGNTNSFFYSGRIAYLGVFDSPLSNQDRYDLYKWIEEYYGITGMPGLQPYADVVTSLSPIAYWPMQETSGTSMTASGAGLSGTYFGGPNLGGAGPTSSLTRAVTFDGVDDYASVALDLSGYSSISVGFWFYANSWTTTISAITHPDPVYPGSKGWVVIPNQNSISQFEVDATDGSLWQTVKGSRPTSGSWHYWGVWFGRGSGTSDIKVYIDGVLSGSKTENSTLSGNFLNSTMYVMRYATTGRYAGKIAGLTILPGNIGANGFMRLYMAT